ncbi:D-alanyl-D-alanine carboxypeptidase [Streptomyces sp. AV19]|nr:D-alanyl-D-alanine carboxypeptidase [Streptomyces sp. AV19]
MAGESPDKSEQGKPSGETAGEHDPRLGARKAPAESDAAARTRHDAAREERDGVRPADAGSDADAKPAEREEAEGDRPKDGAPDAAAPGDARPKGADTSAGDARLKAAVASWVAGADEDAPETIGDASTPRPEASRADRSAESSADQPTALLKAPVIEAPKPAEPEADSEADMKSVATAPAGARTASAGASADQPTALLKAPAAADAPKPAKAKAPAKADSAEPDPGDQPTALIKAPQVKTPEVKTPAAPPKGAPTGDERASRFVPLKSDDAPVAPPKPPRPAVPVKVAPPAPAAPAERPQEPAGPAEAEPTKQTPAPDGPEGGQPRPLDLLAQLTNTPPPPDTPVRSTVRRLKIYTPIAVLLLIVFCVVQAFRPLPDAQLSLGKQAAYTFGGEKFDMKWPGEGQSAAKVLGVGDLGTYGEQKPVPTASMAKVMTAYIILRDHPLKMQGPDKPEQGPQITVDPKAEQEGKAKDESAIRGLKAGQKFSEYDMLQMLLIPSGNNIARLLGRWDAGSEAEFVKKMNAVAKDLGMKNTTYTDPSGLNKTTVSTAVDQVRLAERVIKDPVIRNITTKPNTPIDGLNGSINSNIDDLLIKHTGVLGIKTGSSTPAGGALMWAARKRIGGEELLIVGATMDQHFKGGPDLNAEMSLKMAKNVSYEQLTAVQNGLQQATVVKKGQVVGYVDDQLGGRTPVVATKDVKGFGWGGMKAKFALKPKGSKGSKDTAVPHSAKAGTVVGELLIGSGPDAVKVPVALQKALSEPSFGSKLTRLG